LDFRSLSWKLQHVRSENIKRNNNNLEITSTYPMWSRYQSQCSNIGAPDRSTCGLSDTHEPSSRPASVAALSKAPRVRTVLVIRSLPYSRRSISTFLTTKRTLVLSYWKLNGYVFGSPHGFSTVLAVRFGVAGDSRLSLLESNSAALISRSSRTCSASSRLNSVGSPTV
jgi:hypothetical protein